MAFYEQYLKEHSSQSGNHSATYTYTAYTLQKLYVYYRIGRASKPGLLESLASDSVSISELNYELESHCLFTLSLH